eukprot:2960328-Pleurochrysis_carterae.AAC.5
MREHTRGRVQTWGARVRGRGSVRCWQAVELCVRKREVGSYCKAGAKHAGLSGTRGGDVRLRSRSLSRNYTHMHRRRPTSLRHSAQKRTDRVVQRDTPRGKGRRLEHSR